MWWISYRSEGKSGVDNIGVFEDDGTPEEASATPRSVAQCASVAHPPRLRAGRRRSLHRQRRRKDSHIARYRRRGDTFHFSDLLVTSKQVEALVHPFDVELGDDGRLYVSCQDTNTVLAILPETRKPARVAAHLPGPSPTGTSFPVRWWPPAKAGSPTSAKTRRGMFPRHRVSRWCSTCMADPATPSAGSSRTANIFTWRTRRATPSRSLS